MSTPSDNEPDVATEFVLLRNYLAHLQVSDPTPEREEAMREIDDVVITRADGTKEFIQVKAARSELLAFKAQLEDTTLGTSEARELRRRTTPGQAAAAVSRSQRRQQPSPVAYRQARAEFADELRRLREQAGVSLRAWAARSGVPKSTLGGYLNGKAVPPREALARLLPICGITDPDEAQQWLHRRDELAAPLERPTRRRRSAARDDLAPLGDHGADHGRGATGITGHNAEAPSAPIAAEVTEANAPDSDAPPGSSDQVVDDFDDFFRAEFPRLVAFLCKAGYEVEMARDVATEAMLNALEAWPAIKDPRAWIRRVAGRLVDTAGDARAGWPPGGPQDDEKLAMLVDDHAGFIDLLASLTGQQRMMLAWSLDGFTPAQIAQALRIAPADVRSNLRHVRERIRRHRAAPLGDQRDREG
ncbi:helix-turn-helix domain-containing protein [Amycolatopsis sp. NPDC101161]|uniref:helix-turn-helix domain-containing protein n=1 Tax=Amycolatopsis sp. NPDC101161 TaxID=3363940 RepID=UPI0038064E31